MRQPSCQFVELGSYYNGSAGWTGGIEVEAEGGLTKGRVNGEGPSSDGIILKGTASDREKQSRRMLEGK